MYIWQSWVVSQLFCKNPVIRFKQAILSSNVKTNSTFNITAALCTSVTIIVTGSDLGVIRPPDGVGWGRAIGNKTIHNLGTQRYHKLKKHDDRAQHTVNSFDKLCRNCLQDNATNKEGNEVLRYTFMKM